MPTKVDHARRRAKSRNTAKFKARRWVCVLALDMPNRQAVECARDVDRFRAELVFRGFDPDELGLLAQREIGGRPLGPNADMAWVRQRRERYAELRRRGVSVDRATSACKREQGYQAEMKRAGAER